MPDFRFIAILKYPYILFHRFIAIYVFLIRKLSVEKPSMTASAKIWTIQKGSG